MPSRPSSRALLGLPTSGTRPLVAGRVVACRTSSLMLRGLGIARTTTTGGRTVQRSSPRRLLQNLLRFRPATRSRPGLSNTSILVIFRRFCAEPMG